MLFTDGWQSLANVKGNWSKKPDYYIKLHTYMQRININVTCEHNPGNNYKGTLGCKMKRCWHVYCWVCRDNYTAVTEGRTHSYEKKSALSFKLFTC